MKSESVLDTNLTPPSDSGAQETDNGSSKKKSRSLFLGLGLTIVILLLTAVMFALFYKRTLNEQEIQQLLASGTFYHGISVNGVSIAGLTMEEAKAQLKEQEARIASEVKIPVVCGEQTYFVTAKDFGITFNTNDVLYEAMLLTRSGSFATIKKDEQDLKENGRDFSITYTLHPEAVKERIAEIAQTVDQEPKDASFLLRRATDEQTIANLADSIINLDLTDGINQHVLFVGEQQGAKLDQEALYQELSLRAENKDFSPVNATINYEDPEVTVGQLQQSFVLRGSYKTIYNKSPYNRKSRVHNLKKATGLVDGIRLTPGQVFSANETLGYRTLSNGWQLAPAVIKGGADTEDQPGGGVCQISSTVYVAALQSDLKIVYRQAHSSKLSYVPGGLDATIDSGRIDFKFENSTASDLMVFMWMDKDYVYCEIYGEPMEYDKIVASSVCNKVLSPGKDVYTTVNSLPYGSITLESAKKSGSIWTASLTYYKNGEVVDKKVVDTTTYRAHPNRYLVGPGYSPYSQMIDQATQVGPAA